MLELKSKLRKWGNSFGIVVPVKNLEKEKIQEGDEVDVLIRKKEKRNVLKETFGTIKFKSSIKEIMKESDKELYND